MIDFAPPRILAEAKARPISKPGCGNSPHPGEAYATLPSRSTSRLSSLHRRPETIATKLRGRSVGLSPAASHRAMNCGCASTSRTLGSFTAWRHALIRPTPGLGAAAGWVQPLWNPSCRASSRHSHCSCRLAWSLRAEASNWLTPMRTRNSVWARSAGSCSASRSGLVGVSGSRSVPSGQSEGR